MKIELPIFWILVFRFWFFGFLSWRFLLAALDFAPKRCVSLIDFVGVRLRIFGCARVFGFSLVEFWNGGLVYFLGIFGLLLVHGVCHGDFCLAYANWISAHRRHNRRVFGFAFFYAD